MEILGFIQSTRPSSEVEEWRVNETEVKIWINRVGEMNVVRGGKKSFVGKEVMVRRRMIDMDGNAEMRSNENVALDGV